MFAILILLGWVLFILSAVALVRPLPRLRLGSRKAAAAMMALSLGSCVAGAVMAPPPDPEMEALRSAEREAAEAARAQERIPELVKADPNIRGATLVDDRLALQVHYDVAWDGKGYFDQIGSTVGRLGRVLAQGPVREDPDSQAQEIDLVVSVSGTDRLGHEVTMPWAHLSYSAEDLRRARYGNLSHWRVLALARTVSLTGHQSRRAATEWCQDRARAEEGAAFCRRL